MNQEAENKQILLASESNELSQPKKEDFKQINSISTADNSQEDSVIYFKNDSTEFSCFNKYFMALRPLRPSKATNQNAVNNYANFNEFNANNFYSCSNINNNYNSNSNFLQCQNNNYFIENNSNNILNNNINSNFTRCNSSNNNNNNFSTNAATNQNNINFNNGFYNNFKCTNSKQLFTNFPNFIFKKNLIPLEIFSDLFEDLICEEQNKTPSFGFMVHQTDINEKMRAVLIDWLSEVHLKFKLVPETLFLTVNLIDKFLSKQIISKNHLQLLGVGALLIACKYEEIYCPDLNDFVYITDKAYSKEEIILMEQNILKTLNYEIMHPSILKFYDLISVNFAFSETEYFLGKYFLEMFLLDYRINKYQNSLIACSVVYLVMKINKYEDYRIINSYTLAPEKDLKNCAKEICFLVENIDSTNLLSVKNKYGTKEFHEVSLINFK